MALRSNETFRVTFADGQWIELRCVIRGADHLYALGENNPLGIAKGWEYNIRLLERMINAWSDDTEVNPDTVAELGLNEILKLIGALNEKNMGPTEEERRPLSNGSRQPSRAPRSRTRKAEAS